MTWLAENKGETVLVKFGGNAMINDQLVESFASDVAWLSNQGVGIVVVHGGGPQISAALDGAGIETRFVDGLRFTPKEAVEIIHDVLVEAISKPLAQIIQSHGAKTEVLNGVTEDLLLAEITRPDLGFVGEVYAVRDTYLRNLVAEKVIPVISTIALSDDGELVNVNADLAASSIAAAIGAKELVVLTDVDGLYRNWPDKSSLVTEINSSELETILPNLESGMIPKMQAALAAVYGGVPQVRIINGSNKSALKNLALGEITSGTRVIG